MKKVSDVYYDPQTDGPVKFLPGTYPAFISSLVHVYLKRNEEDKYKRCEENDEDTELIISDYSFTITQEAGTMTVQDTETGEKIHPIHMIGKEFSPAKYAIPALNLKVGDEDRWKNGDYINYHERLGIEFPVKDIDGEKIKQLAKIEEEDVYGMSVWIELKPEREESNDREYLKVFTIKPREGKRITREEVQEDDLPF